MTFDLFGLYSTEDDSKKVDCTEVLAELETINEDLAEIGILLVTTAGKEVASENGKKATLATAMTYQRMTFLSISKAHWLPLRLQK